MDLQSSTYSIAVVVVLVVVVVVVLVVVVVVVFAVWWEGAYFSETEVPSPNRQQFGCSFFRGIRLSRQAPDSLNDTHI